MTAPPTWSVALLLGLASLVWSPRAAVVGKRIALLRPRAGPAGRSGRARSDPLAPGRRRAWAGLAGVAAGLLVGGGTGAFVGLVAAVGVDRLLAARPSAAADDDRAARTLELPGACDLLAVVLAAGLPVGEALAAVGAVLPAPLGAELRRVAALYRLGAEPRRAWSDLPADLDGLGRAMVRAGESGSGVGPALRGLAAESRAAARAATERAVARAGVWVLAPLGLCFLPAFVCLGVVPLVLGIAGAVFR